MAVKLLFSIKKCLFSPCFAYRFICAIIIGMKSPLKRVSVTLLVLMAVVAVWPNNNYYTETIFLVASEFGLQTDELNMQSGRYQNLMMWQTVD
jgi:hypothetical protein